MLGIDFDVLPANQAISVLYSLIVDDVTSVGASRLEAREAIDKKLDEIAVQMSITMKPAEKPEPETAKPFVLTPQVASMFNLKPPAIQPPAKGGDS